MAFSTHSDLFEELGNGCGLVRKNQIITFLYTQYLPLARRVSYMYKSLGFDLAMSCCRVGLLNAVEKYDLTFGVDFAYFAKYHMRSVCQKEMRNNRNIHIPANIIAILEKLIREGVFYKDSEELTPQQLADREEYGEMYRNVYYTLSEENTGSEDNEGTYSAFDSVEQGTFESSDSLTYMKELNSTLERLINRLPDIERTVVIHSIGFNNADELGIRDIGKIIGKSHQTVVNRYAKALGMLRELMLEEEEDLFDNIEMGK